MTEGDVLQETMIAMARGLSSFRGEASLATWLYAIARSHCLKRRRRSVDGQGAYPATDQGLIEVTGLAGDMGRFRAPTLRNIAVTAPYMHDGSIATLEDVIDHYARGGRLITEGPDAGDGRTSPLRSALVGGFTLTGTEREDLLEFLRSLTDDDFLVDPRHADPWAGTVSAAP